MIRYTVNVEEKREQNRLSISLRPFVFLSVRLSCESNFLH
jgi:hypothetical protein